MLSLVTIAGGAMFGAGAFTQVQADRTVTAATVGDGSAYLQLEGTSNYASLDSNEELELTLDSLNGNATTTVDAAFNITVDPSAPGPYTIEVQEVGSQSWSVTELEFQDTSDDTSLTSNSVSVPAGEDVQVRVVVDLSGDSNSVDNIPNEFQIVANQA